jgi:peroxiredoxin
MTSKKWNMKQSLFVFYFILFSSVLFAQDEFTLVKEGQKAPDFTFETAPGKTAKLSDYKGKVVWINFFATWCGPCRAELPHLQKEVFDQYKNNENFVLLILGREHSWDEVNKFKKEQKLTMPFYPDSERKVFSIYANQNIPRNFIVDKNGNIVVSSVGFNEKEFAEIKKKVELLFQ